MIFYVNEPSRKLVYIGMLTYVVLQINTFGIGSRIRDDFPAAAAATKT